MTKQRIAIFASGGGSNARKIMEYFSGSETVEVALVVTNKKDAGVVDIAHSFDVPVLVINRKTFYETDEVIGQLKEQAIDLIVLAGFLWLVPPALVEAFPDSIVNIHPALLPKYGGKGMYGMHVHTAVKQAGEKESGITIHFVNEQYDSGDIIFQAVTPLDPEDSPEIIAQKVLRLEHQHFPVIINQLLKGRTKTS